jgi:tetratricopeptide (TPR) repeat protein
MQMNTIKHLVILLISIVLWGCHKSSKDYYTEGLEYLSKGNVSEAKDAFKISIEKDKNNYNSFCQLGKIYYKDSLFDTATDYFVSANKLNPQDTSCIMYLGKCYYNQDKYDSAIYYLQQIQAKFPQNENCIYLLSLSYLNADNNLIASQFADTLLNIYPNDADYNWVKGSASFGLNKFDDSKYYFIRAIKLDSTIRDCYYYLSLSYNYLNQPDSALFYANKSFRRLNDYKSRFLLSSLFLLRLNNLNESRKEFDQLIDIIKSDIEADNESDNDNDNDNYE